MALNAQWLSQIDENNALQAIRASEDDQEYDPKAK
jgi:hypothetical protein